MWIPRSLLLLSLSSLISLASAATKVTSPSAGDKLTAGQPTVVKWTSDGQGTISLNICYDSGKVCNQFAKDLDNTGSYTWTPDTSLEDRNDYYILLVPSAESKYPSSGVFSISSATTTTSTTSNPATTAGSSSTGTAGSATSASSSATSSASADSGSSSNGAIIGGAIAAVVVVIVVAIIGFIWMRKRNQKKLAEARRGHGDDGDVEAGEKKSLALNGAATGVTNGKKSNKKEAFAPKEGYSEASSIPLAELPAIQQEAVEMSAVPSSPSGGRKFFAMELDSREIPRPGSAVKPDNDPTSNPTSPAVKPSMDKGDIRGTSIDGTTVNSETERPKTEGSIEQIKESSREDLAQTSGSNSGPRTPQEPAPLVEEERSGPSVRDSTPQIGSIPRLGGFDFDTAKF